MTENLAYCERLLKDALKVDFTILNAHPQDEGWRYIYMDGFLKKIELLLKVEELKGGR